MPGVLVLITGHSGVGKTTLADHLVSKFPDIARQFALASKLKDMTIRLFDVFEQQRIEMSDLEDRDKKERYRTYLQRIGTECCRGVFGDAFWCEQLGKSIEDVLAAHNIAIVSDIRYLNEHRWFVENFRDKAAMIFTIKVHRTGYPTSTSHSSEQDIPNITADFELHNDGSIEEYQHQVDRIVTMMLRDIIKNT